MLHLLALVPALVGDPVFASSVEIDSPSGLNADGALTAADVGSFFTVVPDTPWLGHAAFELIVREFSLACPSTQGGLAAVYLSTAPPVSLIVDGLGCAAGSAGELLIDPNGWIPLPPAPFDTTGLARVPLPVPDDAALTGLVLQAQAGMFQPTLATVATLTNRLELTLGIDPNPIAADECEGAPELFVGITPGHNIPYTTSGDPACPIGADRWYRYVAPCTGLTTVTLCESGASHSTDLVLTAWDGTCADRVLIGCSNYCSFQFPPGSEIEFQTVAGRSYLIQLGGYEDSIEGPYTGTYDLVVRCN